MIIGILCGLVLILVNYAIAEFVSDKFVKKVRGSAKSLAIVFADFYFRLTLLAVSFYIVKILFGKEVKYALVTFSAGVTLHLLIKCRKELDL